MQRMDPTKAALEILALQGKPQDALDLLRRAYANDPSNRSVRTLKENFPAISIFCSSGCRFHPELQDAQSRYVRWLPDSIRAIFGVDPLDIQVERLRAMNARGNGHAK